jgi:ketosteroid isomerase-like protein
MAGIVETIERINDAWRTGRVDDLRALFDPGMVIVGPGYEPLARGADACVASYRDFLRASVVHDYQQSAVTVHEAGPVAVATSTWEMEYEQGGRRSHERGTDLFVLRQAGVGWLAVWRAVTFEHAGNPAPAESGDASGRPA